jgi:hypothetical protein
VRQEQRQVMNDFTESKMFRLIDREHWPAIQFYMLTQCRDRGYTLPKGTALGGDTTNNVVIGSVTITPIKSGDFLAGPDRDGSNELGGRIIDAEPEPDEPA